jgi:hypothetical protein
MGQDRSGLANPHSVQPTGLGGGADDEMGILFIHSKAQHFHAILSQLLDKGVLLLLVHAPDADGVHSYDYVVGLSRVSDAKQDAPREYKNSTCFIPYSRVLGKALQRLQGQFTGIGKPAASENTKSIFCSWSGSPVEVDERGQLSMRRKMHERHSHILNHLGKNRVIATAILTILTIVAKTPFRNPAGFKATCREHAFVKRSNTRRDRPVWIAAGVDMYPIAVHQLVHAVLIQKLNGVPERNFERS